MTVYAFNGILKRKILTESPYHINDKVYLLIQFRYDQKLFFSCFILAFFYTIQNIKF